MVDFLVLELFNSNNLLSEKVVGLRLFYPKSFRKNVFLRSSKRLTLNRLTSHPRNLCHNLKRVWCLLVFNLDGINFDQTNRSSSCYLLTEHPNAMKITHLFQNKFYFVVVHERRFKSGAIIGGLWLLFQVHSSQQPIIQGNLTSLDS